KGGDRHYDTTSAFIKSMRGSDPDAALYYMATMITAGEDPKFIARRMIVFASEDVGNADPQALQVAVAAARAVEFVGLPECRINLAQAAVYLARAPKSNAAYVGIDAAMAEVRDHGAQPPPAHLRDASYPAPRSWAAASATGTRTTSPAAWSTSSTCRTPWRAASSSPTSRGQTPNAGREPSVALPFGV